MKKDNQIEISNKDWENVLESINIDSLPIQFLVNLKLNLQNNRVQIIDVKNILRHVSVTLATRKVNEIISKYKGSIKSIDFTVDVTSLQADVTKAREKFTKKVNFKIKREGKKKDDPS